MRLTRKSFTVPLAVIGLAVVLDLAVAQVGKRVVSTWRDESSEVAARTEHPIYDHGFAPKRSFISVYGGRPVPYFTNSLGFRDFEIREVARKAAGMRLLLIGDSFTEGIYYPYAETFAGRIQSALGARGVDVLNAAVSSYAPSVYYAKIMHFLEVEALSFDAVAVFVDIGDIQDESRCYRDVGAYGTLDTCSPARRIEKRFKEWLKDNSVIYRLYRVLKDSRDEVRRREGGGAVGSVTNLYRSRWTVDDAVFADYGAEGLRRSAQKMTELARLLRTRDIALTVVVYPWPDQVLAKDLNSRQVSFWQNWARDNDAAFVNLFPSFIEAAAANDEDPKEIIRRYYVPYDFHFNDAGHALIADAFLAAFEFP